MSLAGMPAAVQHGKLAEFATVESIKKNTKKEKQ